MQEITLLFDDRINEEIINSIALEKNSINNYNFKIEQLEPPEPNIGGDGGWSGALLWISAALAAGFLKELGSDIAKRLRGKLLEFNKKENVIIKVEENDFILIFDCKTIQSIENFDIAIKEVIYIQEEIKTLSKTLGTYLFLDFEYNNEINRWKLVYQPGFLDTYFNKMTTFDK